MVPSRLRQSVFCLAWAAGATAQYINEQLSFRHGTSLSPNGRGVPGWSVSSQHHQVQLLSDRIILTPPVPGNARGALWADNPTVMADWTAEFDFRASGQDQGSGNLQLWFVKDKQQVDKGSVYTVENFDGLALVIDQYGGRGGGIRGFLNDGTQNYKSHSSLESIAFGHCDYSYRNLGRPSKLRVTSSASSGLSVSIDDRSCFSSNKISLPSGYYFGITAATAENPDSFEVYKFVVSSGTAPQQQTKQQSGPPVQQEQKPPSLQKLDRFPGSPEAVPDKAADEIKSQDAQFEDLHNRLQGLTHQLANIFGEFDALSKKLDQRHNEVMGGMPTVPHDAINAMNKRQERMERDIQQLRRDVEGRDYRQHLNSLQEAVEGVRGGITEHLPDTLAGIVTASAPRMGMFLFIVLAVQVMLAGGYIVYKRRRANAPKKYL